MERSAIILTDDSNKFEEDKGLLKLDNKPLLAHVLNAIEDIVEEIVVVTKSKEQAKLYAEIVSPKVRFVCFADKSKGMLGMALAGFEEAEGKYSLLLPFDSPFVSLDVATLFFDCALGKSAVIARSPDCEVEVFNAVYKTKAALEVAKETILCGEFDLEAMVNKLRGVRYMSTMVIEQLDPDFKTFFRIITPLDLKKAVVMLKPRTSTSKKGAAKAAQMIIRKPKKP